MNRDEHWDLIKAEYGRCKMLLYEVLDRDEFDKLNVYVDAPEQECLYECLIQAHVARHRRW